MVNFQLKFFLRRSLILDVFHFLGPCVEVGAVVEFCKAISTFDVEGMRDGLIGRGHMGIIEWVNKVCA